MREDPSMWAMREDPSMYPTMVVSDNWGYPILAVVVWSLMTGEVPSRTPVHYPHSRNQSCVFV